MAEEGSKVCAAARVQVATALKQPPCSDRGGSIVTGKDKRVSLAKADSGNSYEMAPARTSQAVAGSKAEARVRPEVTDPSEGTREWEAKDRGCGLPAT